MSVFVLVHGAWHGSWCWKRVRGALQAQGHEVYTPTLTGVGERSHLLTRHVNLETHIADVVNLIRWEELNNVVLCGHSYGGAVISGAADRIPERIGSLVYLDAFVLENGQSLYDFLPPEQRQMQMDGVKAVGEGWKVPPIPAEVFAVNAKDAPWVNSQCTMQPLATFQQQLTITGALNSIKNVSFVLAQGFHGSPFPAAYEKAKARGWKTQTVPCGHDVMLDMPEELTRILLDATAHP
jgi:pimeloyl-ACP methyl ester carboxylesterase